MPTPVACTLAAFAGFVVLIGCYGTGRIAKRVERRYTAVLVGTRTGNAARAERVLWVSYRYPGGQRRELGWAALYDEDLTAAYERITGRPLSFD